MQAHFARIVEGDANYGRSCEHDDANQRVSIRVLRRSEITPELERVLAHRRKTRGGIRLRAARCGDDANGGGETRVGSGPDLSPHFWGA